MTVRRTEIVGIGFSRDAPLRSPAKSITAEAVSYTNQEFCILETCRCSWTVAGKTRVVRVIFPGNNRQGYWYQENSFV